MNAKRMGLLASLAILLSLFGGTLVHAASQSNNYAAGGTCIPATGGPYCPLANQPAFQQSVIGQQANLISSGNALSDLGTWVANNLGSLFILALVLAIAFGIWDHSYRK